MLTPLPSDILAQKDELYRLWKSQEDLLQQYRGSGIAILGFLAAGQTFMLNFITGKSDFYKCEIAFFCRSDISNG